MDRKAREAVLARRLEELMTKDEILERYLNTVYLGNGAYGVQAGAETYFGVGVAELDIGQSAFLAGMIANPSRFDPIRAPEASQARRDLALRRMVAEGCLTDEAAAYIAGARRCPTAINQVNPETQDYFVEEVKQVLFDDPRLGATREERQNRVFRGGLRIHTTLDPRAQALATTARNDVLAEIAPGGHAHRRSCRSPPTRTTGDAAQRHRRRRVGRAGHRRRAGHGRRRRVREREVQRHHPGRRPLRRVDLQDLRAHGAARERLPPRPTA